MQQLSNFDSWQLYCKELPVPQSFVDWNFYFLIAASLQRRVWIGDMGHQPLFPNIYVTLVGPPSCGKGVSISPTNDALSFWKRPSKPGGKIFKNASEVTPEQMQAEAEVQAVIMGDHELEDYFKKKAKEKGPRLLIPMGANSTTFESLTQTIAQSIYRINMPLKEGQTVPGFYTHCSLAIVLTELSSLFKKQSENIVNLITDLYDCKPYTYRTKHMGEDSISKGCINMLAGTTFSYMEEVFSDRILNEGYASRSFFLVETKPRFFKLFFNKLSDEQMQARQRILDYVKSLTSIYGELHFAPEAKEFLRAWWEDKHEDVYVNKDPRLEYYYGRKNIHAMKMCMIVHFMENKLVSEDIWNMEISLDTVKRVLAILAGAEKNMHQALCFTSNNPIAKASRKFLQLLTTKGQMTWQDIQVEFIDKVDRPDDLKEMIAYLEGIEKIVGEENDVPNLRRKGLVYRIKTEKLE